MDDTQKGVSFVAMRKLIGREIEIQRLSEALGSPSPQVTLVCGQAGIGKTRLVSEVMPERNRLATVAFPHRRFALPGYGMRRLAELSSAASLNEELEELEDEPQGWHVQSIFKAADDLLRQSQDKTLVFDDLQWADELTLTWISQSTAIGDGTSAHVVATLRTTDPSGEPVFRRFSNLERNGNLTILELEPLEIESVSEMAKMFGYLDSDTFAKSLHRLTDGIPLAIQEVLLDLDRRGASPTELDSGANLMTPRLPVINAIVQEQASDLTDDARLVLALTCLVPQPASEKVVKLASGFDKKRFDRALEGAVSSGLISLPRPGTVVFRHELQRESFAGELSLGDRRALHERIAQVLSSDPDSPAGPIAHHLVQAGQIEEALEWYLRASNESMRAHDPGNALTYLQAALAVCPAEDEQMRVRLCEQVVQAARWSNNVEPGLDLITTAETFIRRPKHRARLLIFRARLLSYGGDFDGRVDTLQQAREQSTTARDADGLALALGELAFPLGGGLTLEERATLGQEGLSLSETSNNADLFALCAINLASTTFYLGEETAFALWQRASRALEGAGTSRSELAVRSFYNWSLAALAYGRYDEAQQVLDRGLTGSRSPFWVNSFHGTRALHLWRTGRWDDALDSAEMAIEGVARPQVKALATAIRAGILFEREPKPDLAGLPAAAKSLAEWSDEEFGSIAQAILMRARAARREPDPTRGAMRFVEIIVSSQVRIGWDDLLPALAEVDPRACTRAQSFLGNLRPIGPRAEALLAYTEGLAEVRPRSESVELLLDAAERLLGLPEPYMGARALEAAAARLTDGGRRAGSLRARAAEIYQAIGADRSLANLLRSSRSSRASSRFQIPARHRRMSSPGLTARERDVAALAASGHTAQEIGEALGIATVTVKKHLERIKAKLGVKKKSELVRILAPDSLSFERTD